MSATEAPNDKLQGIVAAYLRCGGDVNYQIKKPLLLCLSVKKFFLIGEYLTKLQAKTRLCCHSSFSSVLATGAQSA